MTAQVLTRPDLTGTWRFNAARSALEIPSPDETIFVIEHRDPVFHFTRTHRFGGTSDTFSLAITTDETETLVDQGALHATCRARWEGEILVFSTRLTREGLEATNIVRYALADADTLVARETFRSASMNYENVWIMERE